MRRIINSQTGEETIDRDFVAPPRPPTTQADVRAEASRQLENLVADYGVLERETWHRQVIEAEELSRDPAADAPFLTARALKRGVAAADLAVKVLAKAVVYATATGAILGARDQLEEEIKRDPTIAPRNWSGWPTVGGA